MEPNPVGSNMGPQLPSFLPSNLDVFERNWRDLHSGSVIRPEQAIILIASKAPKQ